jgi:hypothetical protein
MNSFGQTLFGGSAFVRRALSPFIILFAILMPVSIEKWTPIAVGLMVAAEILCLALLAGFWLPARIGRRAFRVVTALVFLIYAGYLFDEVKSSHWHWSRHRGHSPFGALAGFICIGLPCLWFTLKGRLTILPEPSAEKIGEERRAYEEQILKPDWEFYERHLERPAPAALRELYADRELVANGALEYGDGHGISTFNPLNEQGLLDTREQLDSDIVAIATSDCGDPIYLRPGAKEPDTVYLTCHDADKTEVFAESVAAMVRKLRAANRDLPSSSRNAPKNLQEPA